MSEAIEALRRELGFEVKGAGTDKNYTSCTIIDYGNGFSQVANDAEVKLWAALLAEREKNRKLVEAVRALMKEGDRMLSSCINIQKAGIIPVCVSSPCWKERSEAMSENIQQEYESRTGDLYPRLVSDTRADRDWYVRYTLDIEAQLAAALDHVKQVEERYAQARDCLTAEEQAHAETREARKQAEAERDRMREKLEDAMYWAWQLGDTYDMAKVKAYIAALAAPPAPEEREPPPDAKVCRLRGEGEASEAPPVEDKLARAREEWKALEAEMMRPAMLRSVDVDTYVRIKTIIDRLLAAIRECDEKIKGLTEDAGMCDVINGTTIECQKDEIATLKTQLNTATQMYGALCDINKALETKVSQMMTVEEWDEWRHEWTVSETFTDYLRRRIKERNEGNNGKT